MPVVDKDRPYTAHVDGPYLLCIKEKGNPEMLELCGTSFLFQKKEPIILPMRFYDALLLKNGGNENGNIRIVKKDMATVPDYEMQMKLISGKKLNKDEKKSLGDIIDDVVDKAKNTGKAVADKVTGNNNKEE
jgi:hypothetical protein